MDTRYTSLEEQQELLHLVPDIAPQTEESINALQLNVHNVITKVINRHITSLENGLSDAICNDNVGTEQLKEVIHDMSMKIANLSMDITEEINSIFGYFISAKQSVLYSITDKDLNQNCSNYVVESDKRMAKIIDIKDVRSQRNLDE